MARWKQITNPGTEQQQVFQASEQITPSYIAQLRSAVFPAFNIGLVEGIDTPTTVTGCFSFITGTVGADGKNVTVSALLRLTKYRLTVRTTHPLASSIIIRE